MNDTVFTIVIPIYGVEKYLNQCIDSVINQSYRDIEIILVDDGSKDNCSKICDEYKKKDPRVKVIHKKNGGLVSARKAGAKEAKGEYVICVDGDDWIASDYVQSFFQVIQKFHPDMICCGLIKTDGCKDIYKKIDLASGYYDRTKMINDIYPIAIESKEGKSFPPQLCSKAIRRELYLKEQLSLDDKISIGEDGAVTKPLLTKCNSIFIMDECMYYYRVNLTSLTQTRKGFNWAGPEMIYNHLCERINTDDFDFHDQINRKIAHDIYIVIVSWLRTEKSYRIVKKEINNNIQLYRYDRFLKKCKFSSKRIEIEMFLIRNHFYYPIYLLKTIL